MVANTLEGAFWVVVRVPDDANGLEVWASLRFGLYRFQSRRKVVSSPSFDHLDIRFISETTPDQGTE